MEYYSKIAEGYEELHGSEQKSKLEIIKKHIKLKKEDLLLDVGCGTGISSNFNCKVIGIDPSEGLLKKNKNKNKILAIGENLPFPDNKFDVVVSMTSLHNFQDIKKGILEIQRVGRETFVFSILKKANSFEIIEEEIKNNFLIKKRIDSDKDIIFFCNRKD
ncbi:class I SAM-dependent methyltransferase [Candidatus Woesearchaeota archaeon]|nr:class I SAM-dependent methyltransferase [Candidatus Woesearchaeota archaeon]